MKGVERYTFNLDAIFDGSDLYPDRADVEEAVRSLVRKDLLTEKKNDNEMHYHAKLTRTHVYNRTCAVLTKMGRALLKLGRILKSLKTALVIVAAVVSIMAGLLRLWNP